MAVESLTPTVSVTLHLDAEFAARLGTRAAAERLSMATYVETMLARDLDLDDADRVITMRAAPGVPETIEPSDVVRKDEETDEEYVRRSHIVGELWSIPDLGR